MSTQETPVAQILEELPDGGANVSLPDVDGEDASLESGRQQATTEERAPRGEEAVDAELDGDHALADPRREAIRLRRREERATKKQRQREREDGLRLQLEQSQRMLREMGERLVQVEQRGTAADFAQLESAHQRATQAAQYYSGVIAQATKDQNGDLVAEATRKMVEATNEAQRLRSIRESFAAQSRSGGAQPAMDPSIRAQAEAWQRANSWYDPANGDEDSELALTLDRQVARAGFDPRTKAYWDELDKRIARHLPHRASMEQNGGAPQERSAGTPVAGSGREGGAATGARTSGTYQLSAARVQALKDAGMWDDPKARDAMIREYHAYDRQQAARRG